MKRPKASVLMPVFNSGLFIEDSIESILSQTLEDFEFIIVDDGSTDGTSELLGKYANQDQRIRIITEKENKGIVFVLNRGLQACSGEYVVRMDADDIAIEDRIEKQVGVMDKNKDISVLGAAMSYMDVSGKELGFIRYCEQDKSILAKTPLLHPTVIIRREDLIKHNLCYMEKYRYAEDYFLWLQLGRFGKISAINDVVLKYRIHSQATKIKQLKGSIWATLKVKKDAIIVLKIMPSVSDIFIMIMEFILLLLPARLVLFLYFKTTFKKTVRINL